jgi:hypothetical protein
MPSKKQNTNPGDKNKQPSSQFIPGNEIENQAETEEPPESNKPPDKKEKIGFMNWCKRIRPMVQMIMMLLSVLTLGAYIFVNMKQIGKINSSIKIANSSLIETQRADSIAKVALLHSIHSDSVYEKLAEKDALARERNTRTELRAYLAIKEIKVVYIGYDCIKYNVVVTNTGKTPAYDAVCNAAIAHSGYRITDKYIDDFGNGKADTTKMMRGNGLDFILEFKITDPLITNKIIIDKINAGEVDFYAFGVIWYSDVFKFKHRTRFCYMFHMNVDGTYTGYVYKKYNDGD